MTMTAEDIRILAQTITSIEKLDATTNFLWVKECIRDIVNRYISAAPYLKENFEITEEYGTYKPTRDIVLIDKVFAVENGSLRIKDYELHGTELELQSKGKYQVRYYAMPEMPETRTSDIKLPIQFIDAIKFYVATRIRARLFEQDDQSAVSFYEEYKKTLEKADAYMLRRDKRTHGKMPPGTKKV